MSFNQGCFQKNKKMSLGEFIIFLAKRLAHPQKQFFEKKTKNTVKNQLKKVKPRVFSTVTGKTENSKKRGNGTKKRNKREIKPQDRLRKYFDL